MTQITDIKIADPKAKQLVATAPDGSYDSAPGHKSQLLAFGVVLANPGVLLVEQRLYTIAANGMPTSANMQYDHHQPNGPWVFYEI